MPLFVLASIKLFVSLESDGVINTAENHQIRRRRGKCPLFLAYYQAL